MGRFAKIAFTPRVREAQARMGSRATYARMEGKDEGVDRLGEDESSFLAERDSFYMASVGSDGWPYIQHRGGPKGFVRVLDEHTLAFADYRGNRQYISVGNIEGDDRVALIFVDYPNRAFSRGQVGVGSRRDVLRNPATQVGVIVPYAGHAVLLPVAREVDDS